jgi:nucleotide-binding universal stress UspA family protein
MRFLCGVDGSPPSARAAHIAADLACRLGGELELVRVVGRRGPDDRAAAQAALARLADELDHAYGLRAAVRVESGRPASRLRAVAEATRCDLLVVSCTPRGRLADLLGRGVARALLRRAPCPVMVVAPAATVASYDVVLGFEVPRPSPATAAVAGRLAAALNTSLRIVPLADGSGVAPTGWQIYDATRVVVRAAGRAGGAGLRIEASDRRAGSPEDLRTAVGSIAVLADGRGPALRALADRPVVVASSEAQNV